jgi:hypothetical protein
MLFKKFQKLVEFTIYIYIYIPFFKRKKRIKSFQGKIIGTFIGNNVLSGLYGKFKPATVKTRNVWGKVSKKKQNLSHTIHHKIWKTFP